MSLEVVDSSLMKNILRYLKNIFSDSHFFFHEDYLLIENTDIFNKVLIKVKIHSNNFKNYSIINPFSINLLEIYKVIKTCNRYSLLYFTFLNTYLNLTIKNSNVEQKFNVKFLENNKKTYKLNWKYRHKIIIDSKDLFNLIETFREIDEKIHFIITKNKLIIKVFGSFCTGQIEKQIEFNKNEYFSIQLNAEVLLKILKVYKFSKNICLEFEKKYPLKISFSSEELESEIYLVNELA